MKIKITKPYRRRCWIVQTEHGVAGEIRLHKLNGWKYTFFFREWGFRCPAAEHPEMFAAVNEKIATLNILRRITS